MAIVNTHMQPQNTCKSEKKLKAKHYIALVGSTTIQDLKYQLALTHPDLVLIRNALPNEVLELGAGGQLLGTRSC